MGTIIFDYLHVIMVTYLRHSQTPIVRCLDVMTPKGPSMLCELGEGCVPPKPLNPIAKGV